MSTFDLAVRLTGFEQQYNDWAKKTPNFHISTATDAKDADWVRENFSRAWARQFKTAVKDRAIAETPMGEVTGFVCWNVPKLGFFGPLGVAEKFRGNDIGTGLTLAALLQMERAGYGWAIIHRIGPLAFYKKFLQVVELPRY